VAAAAAVEGGVGAATSASSGVKAKPEAGVRGPAASSHGAEAGTKPRRAPSVASGNATTVSNVTAGSNATESATVPAVPRERPEHVIPANFTARGRNLAGVPPKDRHHHCDGHNNCSVGACTFADCENPVSCNGGACTFYKCVRPTCPGGAVSAHTVSPCGRLDRHAAALFASGSQLAVWRRSRGRGIHSGRCAEKTCRRGGVPHVACE
jgi:hypothetical protein